MSDRILVIGSESPNTNNGSGVIINRLLSNFGKEDLVFLGRKAAERGRISAPYPVYYIPAPKVDSRGERFWQLWSVIPGFFMGLYLIAKYKPKRILAFFPYENALIIAYFLHRVSGIKVFPYLNDLYMENRSGWAKSIAQRIQPRLFELAEKVLVVNKGMARFYKKKYNIEAETIFTSINTEIPDQLIVKKSTRKPYKIGISGNINIDRLDPFQDLLKAVGNDDQFEIHLFSNNTPEYLKNLNAWADNIQLNFFKDANKLIEALAECDLLYIPLTFKTDHSSVEQLSTCLGIKSYDYLVAGVPALVHCPEDYYTAKFYTDRDAGYSYSGMDPVELREMIMDIVENKRGGNQKIVDNALNMAREFTGPENIKKLKTYMRL